MGLLQVIDDAPGFCKATFQGPQGSGKTFTASELACMIHKVFHSTKPIAFYDTESGSDYVADNIAQKTGMKPVRVKTRAFSDLRQVVAECVNGVSDILLVDSITHVWREIQDAYMQKLNEGRRYEKTRMDIQDIMAVKKLWEPWPDDFLNSPLHIIVCGREGNEWGNEEDEETGKSKLIQVGKKMKVEGEFGYEASLMVSMNAEQVGPRVVRTKKKGIEKKPRTIINVATILKDRFNVMNGERFEYPTGETFLPFLQRLKPAAHRPVSTDVHSQEEMPDVTNDGWSSYRKDCVILCEEIQGLLVKHYPGTSAKEKAIKGALIERAFRTRSWTKVESLPAAVLRAGLEVIEKILEDRTAFEYELANAAAPAGAAD